MADMGNEWFYTQNGQAAPAPVSADQLKQLAGSGQLRPDDLVWKEGMPQWMPASSIKGLFGSAKPASADVPVLALAPASGRQAAPNGAGQPARTSPPRGEEGGGILNMNPVVVFVLSLCTCGLFGLIYAILVANHYAEQAARRTVDGAGRPLGTARHPVWVLLMAYLTLGYYFLWWVYTTLRECAAYSGRKDVNARAELGLMLAFPPYSIYVAVFRLPELIRRCQHTAGVPETTLLGHTYVFLNPFMFLALPFLGMIYQDSLNQVWLTAP
jgi:hypothetical protein